MRVLHQQDEREELLRRIPLFEGLPRDELRTITRTSMLRSFQTGISVCEEGRFGEEVFVVIDGEATVSVGGEQIARLGSGGFFGEMALFGVPTRTATVTAVTPLTVLVFSRRQFTVLTYTAPNLMRRMLAEVVGRLRAVTVPEVERGVCRP